MSQTTVDIDGEDFLLNGTVTFPGRQFRGRRIEGLLSNARLIQGIFDDLNPETRELWNYPDGAWDADRNTAEFIAAMPEWRRHGLLSFTVGLQGGSPQGYSKEQPWENSAFTPAGELRPAYFDRLRRILEEADRLGMAPIVSYFYFGQTPRFSGEDAIFRGAQLATDWLVEQGFRNVLVEVVNEAHEGLYAHQPLLQPHRISEVVRCVQERADGKVDNAIGRFYTGASLAGGCLPPEELVNTADLVLLHGNGVSEPGKIREMVRAVRQNPAYQGQPIVFNEDDHFAFDEPDNNFLAATSEHASWGYFDYRKPGEPFETGYQSMPCDWGIRTERKRGFFRLLAQMTGNAQD